MRKLLPLFIITVIVCSLLPLTARKEQSPSRQSTEDVTRRKARYFFVEGARLEALDSMGEAYEMYRHAARIDPSYAPALYNAALNRMRLRLDTFNTQTQLHRTLEDLRPFVDENPGDFAENYYYAYVNERLDSVPEAIRVYKRLLSIKPDKTNILLHLSDSYARLDSIDRALDYLYRFETAEGPAPQLTIRMANLHLSHQDTVGALREVNRLLATQPDNPQYLVFKAQFMQYVNEPDSAFKALQYAEEVAPESGVVKVALADYYMDMGDSVAYDNKVYEALLTDDLLPEQKIEIFRTFLQSVYATNASARRGDYVAEKMLQQFPHEPMVLTLCGDNAAARDRFDEAAELFQYAIDLDPAHSAYQRMARIRAFYAGEKWDEALKEYELQKPYFNNSDTLRSVSFMAAYAAFNDKQNQRGINILKDEIERITPAIGIDTVISLSALPRDISYDQLKELSSLYCTIADFENTDADLAKAYNNYENALLLFPDNFLAANNYAYRLSENKGNLDKAEELAKRVIDSPVGTNPTYIDTYAWVLYRKGRYEEARHYIDLAIQGAEEDGLTADDVDLLNHLADILTALGEPAGARHARERAAALPEAK